MIFFDVINFNSIQILHVPVLLVSMAGLVQMMDRHHTLAHVLSDILVTAAKSKVNIIFKM